MKFNENPLSGSEVVTYGQTTLMMLIRAFFLHILNAEAPESAGAIHTNRVIQIHSNSVRVLQDHVSLTARPVNSFNIIRKCNGITNTITQ
jgi:hypothetical protein